MRPSRLELQGFSAFRELAVVDFGDADLFALTGPTGSGKSSLIDAITFALYGSVPRHGKGSVAPVVTQGTLQARVRLDFTVGTDCYTVARVVRKDARGRANTDEARLETGDRVLAGSAPEVTAEVTRLLGLDYEQFTTCVVLPQGKFERFLHAKPSERQGLLVALLGLDIYESVARSAVERQRIAEGRLSEIDARLGQHGEVDERAVTDAGTRVRQLKELLTEIEDTLPQLEKLEEQIRLGKADLATIAEHLIRLDSVDTADPDATQALSKARAVLQSSEAECMRVAAALAEAEARRGEFPSREVLEGWQRDHVRLADERKALEGCRLELEHARKVQAAAGEALNLATEALEAVRSQHTAQHLRRGLTVGDPCPVCTRPIEELPAGGISEDLDQAIVARDQAATAQREAEARVTALISRAGDLEVRIEEMLSELSSRPGLEEVRSMLAGIDEIESHLSELRRAHTAAKEAVDSARQRVDGLAEAERLARLSLQQARDAVAALSPPTLGWEDVVADWRLFVSWIEETRPELSSRHREAAQAVESLVESRRDLAERIGKRCEEYGVDSNAKRPRDAVYDALTAAKSEEARLHEVVAEIELLRKEHISHTESASVAKELARHLKANNFEKWLLDEALRVLAAGANRRLGELARGQYSLALNERLEFEVVDHHAADERRTVRGLSGGETFLVSLALALSLADHITEMAAAGSSRLEAIFLDEGFGTLDAETLETVASVIAEIGASGKMVGLVTHVTELAAQVPVRFEVSKDVTSARVQRVES